MEFLSQHLKETADIMDGYLTGRLFVENGTVGLQRKQGEADIHLDDSYLIEIRNGDVFETITIRDALTAKTSEEWPLYAGLYTRVKRRERA